MRIQHLFIYLEAVTVLELPMFMNEFNLPPRMSVFMLGGGRY